MGAGAIGKSVTGYIFSRMGYRVVFADISEPVVADINIRGSYTIYSCETGMAPVKERVLGISACVLMSKAAAGCARQADFICTAVGPAGLRSFLPTLAAWIKARISSGDTRPLYVLLFENDAQCKNTVCEYLRGETGLPEWLTISKTSIERMTRPCGFDVTAEQFIPVIASARELGNSPLAAHPDLFMLTGNPDVYYYRKLYTNNLGHALLGYMGTYYRYETVCEAMKDPKIADTLINSLTDAQKILRLEYGFSADELALHTSSLIRRYRNKDLNDSLRRLAKDPLRKLASDERIIGALNLCSKHNVPPDRISLALFYALKYCDGNDPSAAALRETFEAEGLDGVLSRYCGLSAKDTLYQKINEAYRGFNY